MKAFILIILLMQPALAAGQHSVAMSWTAPTDFVTGETYNVYRVAAPGVCPTTVSSYAKVNTAPVTATSYTDSTIAAGKWCFVVTAFVNGMESGPTNTINPAVSPLPPTGLTLTSVSLFINGHRSETFTATILDAPGLKVSWTLTDPLGRRLQGGSAVVPMVGRFSLKWSGRPVRYVVFSAKDSDGHTISGKYSIS